MSNYLASLTRRGFIATTAASAALAALPIRVGLWTRALGIIDPATPYSSQFASALPHADRIALDLADPRALVTAIAKAHSRDYAVLACTREGTAFVVNELLRGNQASVTILVHHDIASEGRARHEVIGIESGTLLRAALSGPNWAAKLARVLAPGSALGEDIEYADAGAGQRAGRLVTWLVTA